MEPREGGLGASGNYQGQTLLLEPEIPTVSVRLFVVSCSSLHRAASGPTALFRNTKAAGAAIGGVKNMLLEWCRAMTRNYEVGTGWGYRRDKGHFSPGQ